MNSFPLTHQELVSEGPPRIVDNTLRSTFRSCPRKLYWFMRGYDYASTPAYFTFGKAWGMALGLWYERQAKYKDEWHVDSVRILAKMDALEAARTLWQKDAPQEFRNDTFEQLERLWALYVEVYPSEHWTVIGSEQGFVWPLKTTDTDAECFVAGSIDAYIEWPMGQVEEFGREDKTSGVWLSDNVLDQYNFSSQILTYYWFLREFRSKEPFGYLVNIACKQISKAGNTPQFGRTLVKKTPYDLEEFEKDLREDFRQLERLWSRQHWPKTTDQHQCAGGVGKAPCLFRPLCSSGVPPQHIDPLSFSAIAVRKEKWEPWKRSGESE